MVLHKLGLWWGDEENIWTRQASGGDERGFKLTGGPPFENGDVREITQIELLTSSGPELMTREVHMAKRSKTNASMAESVQARVSGMHKTIVLVRLSRRSRVH